MFFAAGLSEWFSNLNVTRALADILDSVTPSGRYDLSENKRLLVTFACGWMCSHPERGFYLQQTRFCAQTVAFQVRR